MKRPSPAVLILGHPLICIPLLIAGAVMLWACWQRGADALLPALLTIVGMFKVHNASDRASEYRTWKRAWDGMAGAGRSRAEKWRQLAAVALVALVVAYGSGNLSSEAGKVGLGVVALLSVLWLAWVLTRRAFRLLPAARDRSRECVSLAVSSPLLRVPRLDAAYQALPEHCQRVLGKQSP